MTTGLLSLTNELLLHIFQFLEPEEETQSLPVVCRRFLECVETPHLWRLMWLRWYSSDAGLLEDTVATVAGKAGEASGEEHADADPMDHEEATKERQSAVDGGSSGGGEESLCKKPAQRLACHKMADVKRKVLKHYTDAQAEYNSALEANNGDEEALQEALEKFDSVRANVVLNFARHGCDQILKWLVRADMLTTHGFGEPGLGMVALRVAAGKGHAHVVRYLLHTQNVDPNLVTDQPSALYAAAKKGRVSVIRELASAGADLDLGIAPAHSGGCGGCSCGLNLARFFGGAPVAGSSPLWVAAARNKPEAVRVLLELGADIDKKASDGTTPFFIACKENALESVKVLLDPSNKRLPAVNEPAGQDDYGSPPLYVACHAGSQEVAEYLLANAARIGLNVDACNQNDATPLYISWYSKHALALKSVTMRELRVLMITAHSQVGHLALAEKLIAAGANLEARRKSGATPLLIASSYGHEEVVDRLLKAGAQVNPVGFDGATPLSCAAAEGHEQVVARLLAAGADVNAGGPERLPAREAQRNGHLGIVITLLQAGAVAPPEEEDDDEEDEDEEDNDNDNDDSDQEHDDGEEDENIEQQE